MSPMSGLKAGQTNFLTFSLPISEMMWLGKGNLFYIPNIYLFYKSIKYSIYEREKECYTLVNKTWNKNEYTWKNTMGVGDNREYFILKSDTSDF